MQRMHSPVLLPGWSDPEWNETALLVWAWHYSCWSSRRAAGVGREKEEKLILGQSKAVYEGGVWEWECLSCRASTESSHEVLQGKEFVLLHGREQKESVCSVESFFLLFFMLTVNTVLVKCALPFSAWKQCVGNHDADGCLPTCHLSLPQPEIILQSPVSFKTVLQEYTFTVRAKEKPQFSYCS